MKKAISNIAWLKEEDKQVFELMKKYGYKGLEIAPTRTWDEPFDMTNENVKKYDKEIEDKGLCIVGMQALLFGHPELKIFNTKEVRIKTLEYLKECILLASKLNTKFSPTLVFGSPKNRVIGRLPRNKAIEIAIEFFSQLGTFAYKNNVIFCIEANAKEYQTDFINTTEEGLELVKSVNNKGFRLHVDTSTIFMNKENYEEVIEKAIDYTAHFHISEPYLNLLSDENIEHHVRIANILKKLEYNEWVSIEMKNGLKESNIEAIEYSMNYVNKIYE